MSASVGAPTSTPVLALQLSGQRYLQPQPKRTAREPPLQQPHLAGQGWVWGEGGWEGDGSGRGGAGSWAVSKSLTPPLPHGPNLRVQIHSAISQVQIRGSLWGGRTLPWCKGTLGGSWVLHCFSGYSTGLLVCLFRRRIGWSAQSCSFESI